MKRLGLPARPQRLMWDAHSVVGVFFGLALFVIFFAGAFALFYDELGVWERQASGSGAAASPVDRAPLLTSLEREFTLDGRDVQLLLPSSASTPYRAYWFEDMEHPDADEHGFLRFEAGPGSSVWRPDSASESLTVLLYDLHFFEQLGAFGLYTAGFMAVFMLLGLTTGVLIHLRKLVREFHQFRPASRLRKAWTDAHTLIGTIGLPFQLVFAFTGVYFGLLGLILAPYAFLVTDGDIDELYSLAGVPVVHHVDSDVSVSSIPLDEALRRFESRWPSFRATSLTFEGYGIEGGVVSVTGQPPGPFQPLATLVLDGTTGEELEAVGPGEAGPLAWTVQAFTALHFATYAGGGLRTLLLMLSFATCLMILTGNYLWIEVRTRRGGWIRLALASLTTGVANGLVFATAASFLLRALGMTMPIGPFFFGVWGLIVAATLALRIRTTRLRPLLWTSATMFLSLSVLDGLVRGDWIWIAFGTGSPLFLVELVFLVLSVGITLLAALPPGDVERGEDTRLAPNRREHSMPVGGAA